MTATGNTSLKMLASPKAVASLVRKGCTTTSSRGLAVQKGRENLPGTSIFKRDAEGQVYHTYSVFGTALLELVQYNFMFDLTPEGRPAGAPEMSFLKHRDAYQFPDGVY